MIFAQYLMQQNGAGSNPGMAQSRPSGCKLRYRRRRFIRDITSLVWAITTPRISIRPMGDFGGRERRETKHYAHAIFNEEGGDLRRFR